MLLRGSGKRKLDFGEYRSIRNQVELNLIYLENCSTHSGVGSLSNLHPRVAHGAIIVQPLPGF
jgi:hypothetical protein